MTDAERRLWWRLRLQQLEGHRFRRRVPIGPYIVDFACLAARLVIEVDGGQHAAEPSHDASGDFPPTLTLPLKLRGERNVTNPRVRLVGAVWAAAGNRGGQFPTPIGGDCPVRYGS